MNKNTGAAVSVTSEWGELFSFAHAIALLLVYWLWRIRTGQKVRPCFDKTKKEVLARAPTKNSTREEPTEEKECEKCALLGEKFPLSTTSERRRFVLAHPDVNAASAQLQTYLEWREEHELIEKELLVEGHEGGGDDDQADWNRCAAVAMCASDEIICARPLPRLARMYSLGEKIACDRDGMRLLHVMPGQMDSAMVNPSTYASTLALYIDHQLERSSTEQITVLIDVRGGQGWPNTMPHKQLPFIQTVTKLLLGLFPERCHRCILYPVPTTALWIWHLVKVWIDPATASKMVLLCGPATIRSPPPYSQMEEYMDKSCVELLEKERLLAFVEPTQ